MNTKLVLCANLIISEIYFTKIGFWIVVSCNHFKMDVDNKIWKWFSWTIRKAHKMHSRTFQTVWAKACLPSIRNHSPVPEHYQNQTTNMSIAWVRGEPIPAVNSSGPNANSSLGRAVEFKFLLDPWLLSQFVSGQSFCWRCDGSDFQVWNAAISRGIQCVSFRFEITSLCQSIIKLKQQVHMLC